VLGHHAAASAGRRVARRVKGPVRRPAVPVIASMIVSHAASSSLPLARIALAISSRCAPVRVQVDRAEPVKDLVPLHGHGWSVQVAANDPTQTGVRSTRVRSVSSRAARVVRPHRQHAAGSTSWPSSSCAVVVLSSVALVGRSSVGVLVTPVRPRRASPLLCRTGTIDSVATHGSP